VGSNSDDTRFDEKIRWIKNHRGTAMILLFGAVVIALGEVTGAIDSIVSFTEKRFTRAESRKQADAEQQGVYLDPKTSCEPFSNRPRYLERQLEMERSASQLLIVTHDFSNAIVTPEYRDSVLVPKIATKWPGIENEVLNLMRLRQQNLRGRLNEGRLLRLVLIYSKESIDSDIAENGDIARRRYAEVIKVVRQSGARVRLCQLKASDIGDIVDPGGMAIVYRDEVGYQVATGRQTTGPNPILGPTSDRICGPQASMTVVLHRKVESVIANDCNHDESLMYLERVAKQ